MLSAKRGCNFNKRFIRTALIAMLLIKSPPFSQLLRTFMNILFMRSWVLFLQNQFLYFVSDLSYGLKSIVNCQFGGICQLPLWC